MQYLPTPLARTTHPALRSLLTLALVLAIGGMSPPAHAANTAPRIWGTPATWVGVDKPYSFQPNAADADRDKLRFSVANKPGWLSFNPHSGRLVGTPGEAQAGRKFAGITIRVSDGRTTRVLKPFTLTVGQPATRDVTLHWTRPSRNLDGTPLKNLAGYRVFYGQASRKYTRSLNIPMPSVVSAVIENLPHGTWYFAVKSVNSRGVTSAYSAEARTTI